MIKRQKSPFIFGGRWFSRRHTVRAMEASQDIIVICLCIGLFGVMAIKLVGMFTDLVHPPLEFKKVTSDILFLLIMVEIFRLLMIYLEEHSISVGVAVEVTIVSVLREVIVHGAFEASWVQIISICLLLFILGALLLVCARTPHMDQPHAEPIGLTHHGDHHAMHHGGDHRSELSRREPKFEEDDGLDLPKPHFPN